MKNIIIGLALALAGCDLTDSPVAVEVVTDPIPIKIGKQVVTRQVIKDPAKTVEVAVPAVMESRTRQVMKTPARTMERVVPSVTKQVTRRDPVTGRTVTETMVVSPASTTTVTIPAEYDTIQETVVVKEAGVEQVEIPAVFETVTEQVEAPIVPFSWDMVEGNHPPAFDPPNTEVKFNIPHEYFRQTDSSDPNLWQVYEAIADAIKSDGDPTYGSRVYKYDNGFVVLTKAERIDEDAVTIMRDNQRIGLFEQESKGGLFSFLDKFFNPPKNRYRFIAFIVTNAGFVPSSEADLSGEDFTEILVEGGLKESLPKAVLEKFSFTEDKYLCQVRIYDFAKIGKKNPDDLAQADPHPAPLPEPKHKTGSPVLKTVFQ